MSDSLQKWVGRNRPPRVQITYDVEIGDAVEKKELPLVVGLMADLSGALEPAAKRRIWCDNRCYRVLPVAQLDRATAF